MQISEPTAELIKKQIGSAFPGSEVKEMEVTGRNLAEGLPRKFTISQLRSLYDTVHQTSSDVRNFQKKVAQWPYVVALDEVEEGVPHRAARLYKYKK